MGWSPGLNSIHPGSTSEAPVGSIKKTSTKKTCATCEAKLCLCFVRSYEVQANIMENWRGRSRCPLPAVHSRTPNRSRDNSPNVPLPPRNTKQKADLQQWIAHLPPETGDLPPEARLPVGMSQIALWFADTTDWKLESRQLHGTCIACSFNDEDLPHDAPPSMALPTSGACRLLPYGLGTRPPLISFSVGPFPRDQLPSQEILEVCLRCRGLGTQSGVSASPSHADGRWTTG